MIDIVFDMETHDPDDYLTLLLLLGHPEVNLKAVTITPGSPLQVGLVQRTLARFGQKIPVGAFNINHPKSCVSSWHPKAYGTIEASMKADIGGKVLVENCDENTTLITGAPLKNLGVALDFPNFKLGRLVAQGGFAGEGVIPTEKQLPKFRGMTTCPTFNLNGDPKSALRALQDSRISTRYFVSKNVCHGVYYDQNFHQLITPLKKDSLALGLIWKGMDFFLKKKLDKEKEPLKVNEAIQNEMVQLVNEAGGLKKSSLIAAIAQAKEKQLALVEVAIRDGMSICKIQEAPKVEKKDYVVGKKLHDPLAACCAIDLAIGQWAEVELYRENGKWGSQLCPHSNTWIITDYDHQRFVKVFTAC